MKKKDKAMSLSTSVDDHYLNRGLSLAYGSVGVPKGATRHIARLADVSRELERDPQ